MAGWLLEMSSLTGYWVGFGHDPEGGYYMSLWGRRLRGE